MATEGKGKADYLQLGDWNAACYQCGRKFKASTLRRNWQGFWVCPPHWEPRQPQDFVRGVQDIQTVPWVQPINEDFVVFCTPNAITAIANFAVANCAIADRIASGFDPNVT